MRENKNEEEAVTICGIVMPISKSDDSHTTEHWLKVQHILAEAIAAAGCKPQPVWEGGSADIIQEKILKNLFENPIVVCDLSTRNPNVMLEVGMRLTTKKPTLLVAEAGTDLPFDTGIIQTEFYDPSLEYAITGSFIATLSSQIKAKHDSWRQNSYRPYLASFEFETVEPSTVSVSAEKHLGDLIERTEANLERLERLGVNRVQISADNLRKFTQPHISVQAFAKTNPQRVKSLIGGIVKHEVYGLGTLVSLSSTSATVDFEKEGTRTVPSENVLIW